MPASASPPSAEWSGACRSEVSPRGPVRDQAVEVFERVELVVEDVAAVDGALIGAAAVVEFREERAEQGELLHAADDAAERNQRRRCARVRPRCARRRPGQVAGGGPGSRFRPRRLRRRPSVASKRTPRRARIGSSADGGVGDEFQAARTQVGRAAAAVDQCLDDTAGGEVGQRDGERVDGEVATREVGLDAVGQVHDVDRAVGQGQAKVGMGRRDRRERAPKRSPAGRPSRARRRRRYRCRRWARRAGRRAPRRRRRRRRRAPPAARGRR